MTTAQAKWPVAILAALLVTAPMAMAQTPTQAPPVIALAPSPHPATCSDFTYAGNGGWTPTGPVRVRDMITMNPGVTFHEGVAFAGIDLAQQLNQKCKTP